MTFITATLWFIMTAKPHQHTLVMGSVGPIATYEQCEIERKHMAKNFDDSFAKPFIQRTKCIPINTVIGVKQ